MMHSAQNQLELHSGNILHLVNYNKIISGLNSRDVMMAEHIVVIELLPVHKSQIALKQTVNLSSLGAVENGLFDAQSEIFIAA